MKLYHKKCKYEWNFQGKRTKRATCPNCGQQIDIEENKVKVI